MQGPNNAVTIAKDVNILGQVVGYYYHVDDDRGFLWTRDEGFQTLPMPPGGVSFQATAISDAGVIVGTVETPTLGGYRAFILANGAYTLLSPFNGGNFTDGLDVNGLGQVAGYWGNNQSGNPGLQAFLYDGNEMRDLWSDLGTPEAVAHAINDSGYVAGWRGTADFRDATGFIWHDGSIVSLPAIAGGITSEIRGINSAGDVAGFGWTADPTIGTGYRHAFACIDGQMTQIDPLPGFQNSIASGINDQNCVVGHCRSGNILRAFAWRSSQTEDLTDVLNDPAISFKAAGAINNNGQIVGYGTRNGAFVGLLLTPRRSAADLDGDCYVGLVDLSIMLSEFGCIKECSADINADGSTTLEDLAILLGAFGG